MSKMKTELTINARPLRQVYFVARVCREINLAAWLDAQDPDNRQLVSVGTATMVMILNGLGKSLRQLYLVPQFFASPMRMFRTTFGSET